MIDQTFPEIGSDTGGIIKRIEFRSIIKLNGMNKTYQTELFRIFLIEGLPEPLDRSSRHLQIFDNYIGNTRIRLRSMRIPETNEWSWSMQQIIYPDASSPSFRKFAEIHLNESEYAQFQIFEGSEIRKNRYFHEFDGRMFTFDVYLGELLGLNIAKTGFEDNAAAEIYLAPSFAAVEISGEPFFAEGNLVHCKFEDVRTEIGRISEAHATVCKTSDD